jgi:hypothetical protein
MVRQHFLRKLATVRSQNDDNSVLYIQLRRKWYGRQCRRTAHRGNRSDLFATICASVVYRGHCCRRFETELLLACGENVGGIVFHHSPFPEMLSFRQICIRRYLVSSCYCPARRKYALDRPRSRHLEPTSPLPKR